MDVFVIFLEIYSGESAVVNFPMIITNIDWELLSCLTKIWYNTINEICSLCE